MRSNKLNLDTTVYIVVFFICYMCFISTFAREGAVRIPFYYKQISKYIIQQGWAFFTKNPRESLYNLYALDSDGNIINDKIVKPHTHYSNLFGISRKPRRLGFELSAIVSNVRKKHWYSACCISDISLEPQKTVFISNPMIKYLEGDYVVVKEESVPWAYFSNNQKFKSIIEYAIVHVN